MARIYIRTPGAKLIANKPYVDISKLSRRLKHEHRMEYDEEYRERVNAWNKKRRKHLFIKSVAARLNKSLPKSEVWFNEEWNKLGMSSPLEKANVIFSGRIPDIINKRHRYIIEINGSVHSRPDVQRKDRIKYRLYIRRKYKFWVINHGDMKTLAWVARQVRGRRTYMEQWIKDNPHLNVNIPDINGVTTKRTKKKE